jgi:uncharacterized membrane protein
MTTDISIWEILLNWKIVLIVIVVIFVLPIIFYFVSLDKNAVKMKKIKIAPQKAKAVKKEGPQPGSVKTEEDRKETAYESEDSAQLKEKR